jgi:hypothetical protein
MTGVGKSGDHINWLNNVGKNKEANPSRENTQQINELSSLQPLDKGIENSKTLMGQGLSKVMIEMFGNDTIIAPDPKGVVDDIRNAEDTNSRNKLLIGFQSKIDNMSSKDLMVTRDYIISIMEKPTNKDDELMFLLLKTVNKRLDAEHQNNWYPKPMGPIIMPHDFQYDINKHGPKLMFD